MTKRVLPGGGYKIELILKRFYCEKSAERGLIAQKKSFAVLYKLLLIKPAIPTFMQVKKKLSLTRLG